MDTLHIAVRLTDCRLPCFWGRSEQNHTSCHTSLFSMSHAQAVSSDVIPTTTLSSRVQEWIRRQTIWVTGRCYLSSPSRFLRKIGKGYAWPVTGKWTFAWNLVYLRWLKQGINYDIKKSLFTAVTIPVSNICAWNCTTDQAWKSVQCITLHADKSL